MGESNSANLPAGDPNESWRLSHGRREPIDPKSGHGVGRPRRRCLSYEGTGAQGQIRGLSHGDLDSFYRLKNSYAIFAANERKPD
jgi:hypothetical protein